MESDAAGWTTAGAGGLIFYYITFDYLSEVQNCISNFLIYPG